MIPLLVGLAAIGGLLWFARPNPPGTPQPPPKPNGPPAPPPVRRPLIEGDEVYVFFGALPGGPTALPGLPPLPPDVVRVVMKLVSLQPDTVTGTVVGYDVPGTGQRIPITGPTTTVPRSAIEPIVR